MWKYVCQYLDYVDEKGNFTTILKAFYRKSQKKQQEGKAGCCRKPI